MKRVYVADSLVDARLVADWLEGNGMPCEIFNQNAVGALGELPVTSPEVWLRREQDYDRARHIVETVIFHQREEERRCGHCGEINPAGFDICWRCQRTFTVA